ncbi:MAG: ABC transporter substrate-binding protein [Deltaproteobacteria bacterium]|nr:ABC transporter substrate-binding protein [Deltaproteobacteria bacterium]
MSSWLKRSSWTQCRGLFQTSKKSPRNKGLPPIPVNLVLAIVLFLTACGSEKKEEKAPQGFEELVERVVVKPEDQAMVEEDRLYKIGVIGPLTGEEAEFGRMTLDGVMLAKEVLDSSGGINGHNIDVVYFDNGGKEDSTKSGMIRFIEDDKVVAIISAPTGWATFGPVYIANENSTIQISAGTRRHIGRSGPFIFRNSLPGEKAAERLMKYAVEKKGMKTFALVTVMEDEGLSISSFFRMAVQSAGASITSEGHIFTGLDIKEVVNTVKKAGQTDAVIFVGGPEDAVLFLKAASKAGIKAPLIGGEELYSEKLLKEAGDMLEGSLVYASFSVLDNDPHTKKFIELYRNKKGVAPTLFVAEAYDSFMLIADALLKAGAPKPSLVRDRLAETKGFRGVAGAIDMDSEGEAVRAPYILNVERDGDGVRFVLAATSH